MFHIKYMCIQNLMKHAVGWFLYLFSFFFWKIFLFLVMVFHTIINISLLQWRLPLWWEKIRNRTHLTFTSEAQKQVLCWHVSNSPIYAHLPPFMILQNMFIYNVPGHFSWNEQRCSHQTRKKALFIFSLIFMVGIFSDEAKALHF